jgi:uncharacterized protein YPO0396
MKKWMTMVLVGVFTAGMAVAETNSVPWYKKPFGKSSDEKTQVIPPAPAAPVATPAAAAPRMQAREGMIERRGQANPEQMEKMKAQRDALMKLGEAARNETDPAKKEALVAQLRAKVTEMNEKMLAELKKRVEQADQEMPKLKERLADAEENKATRIEEQVQRILKGEPIKRPEGKRPEGASLKKEGKKAVTPAVTQ